MNDTGTSGMTPTLAGAGLPANAITQAMTVVLLTHSRASPLLQGSAVRL